MMMMIWCIILYFWCNEQWLIYWYQMMICVMWNWIKVKYLIDRFHSCFVGRFSKCCIDQNIVKWSIDLWIKGMGRVLFLFDNWLIFLCYILYRLIKYHLKNSLIKLYDWFYMIDWLIYQRSIDLLITNWLIFFQPDVDEMKVQTHQISSSMLGVNSAGNKGQTIPGTRIRPSHWST